MANEPALVSDDYTSRCGIELAVDLPPSKPMLKRVESFNASVSRQVSCSRVVTGFVLTKTRTVAM